MAGEPKGSRTGMVLALIAAIVLLGWAAWQFGLFGTGQEEAAPGYRAGVTGR